jgi:hypothetical protein
MGSEVRSRGRWPLLTEDLAHGGRTGGERGPDLVSVDGLGDRSAAVAHQIADVLDADAVGTRRAGVRDTVDPFDRDQIILNDVHDRYWPTRSR